MRLKKLSLLALSDVQGSGVLELEESTIIFSGLDEKRSGNQRGVAVVLRNKMRMGFKKNETFNSLSERLLKVRLQLESTYISIIAVYAPNEVDVAIEAENFYEKLQDLVAETNQKDVIITLGDFNARIGPSTTPSRLHGPYNPDKKNQNGTRLVNLCNRNGLVITNTIFPHKKIHQWTWSRPRQKEGGHVLDYVLINQDNCSLITDTRAYRKTKHISDHNIIISSIQLSKKTYKNNISTII